MKKLALLSGFVWALLLVQCSDTQSVECPPGQQLDSSGMQCVPIDGVPDGGMGGAGGVGGVGGTGGRPPGEDCGDDTDNDGDGDIDCMDSDCATHACVPSPPGGWMGPVQLYDDATSGIPACGGAFPTLAYEGNRDLVCPAATCSDCACTATSGGTCRSAETRWHQNDNCGGGSALNFATLAPSCGALNFGFGNPMSVSLTARTSIGGTCDPAGGDATTVPESWNAAGRACAAATPVVGGCAVTQRCVPRPATGFLPSVCYYMDGDVGCPGAYTDRHVFYGGADDTRGCASCSCGDFVGNLCPGTLSMYDNAACDGSSLDIPTGSPCTNLGATNMGNNFTFSGSPSGSCPPSGGGPSGACTETMATTVCCLP